MDQFTVVYHHPPNLRDVLSKSILKGNDEVPYSSELVRVHHQELWGAQLQHSAV
jgi:hypothetical protein